VTEKQTAVFFEIHSDLPRETPGSVESTQMAFASVVGLPPYPEILDIGCGPGAQTMAIAAISEGCIHAVDNHCPFIRMLEKRVKQTGMKGRILPSVADMKDLPFEAGSFDLIWAEGSIYNIGVRPALELWRPLLRENGHIAFTELSWLRRDLPEELRAYWTGAYPAMTTISGNVELLEAAGFEMVRRFTLPERDWWEGYYNPLLAKMPALKEKYRDDPEAMEVLAGEEYEIDLFRRYCKYYGYIFYVAKRIG
jgi:ubiquinone/menaquinone biosynthesis C-methylase UbiE